ncbi:MAG TPA: Ig-like domain-containing protein [Anaerolineales bacterium]|nr:Ig-like domain-containing protein [Anaerolineales bacterium]
MRRLAAGLTVLMALAIAGAAHAQGDLSLELHRDFGFAWGGQVQGKFTIEAQAEDLAQVVFLIDGQTLGEAGREPFEITFHTGDFALGWHTLWAEATTRDGQPLRSDEIRIEFVSAEAGGRFALQVALPIFAVVVVVMLAGTVLPMAFGRRTYRPGQYGVAGGAVCPRCRLPFSRHALGLNLGLGKLERCPHCGRWSVVGRATSEALAEAEARWRSEGSAPVPGSDEERLRRQIDDSRYLE